MTNDVTLLGLRVLAQVAASGSFAAAAVDLDYTQSAVSRQMAGLESALGEVLFERQRRGVILTPAGEIVLAGARRTLAEVEATGQRLAGRRDRIAGRLVIGAFPSAAAVLVPRAVAALVADHPTLQVVLDEAATPTLLRRLRAGRSDVAVVALGAGGPELDVSGLARHPLPAVGLRVAVPSDHRLARRRVVGTQDLTDESWIAGTGDPGDPQFGAWPTLTDPRIAHTARHWSTRLGLVAAGLGITVLPGTMAGIVPVGVQVLVVDDPAWPARGSVLVTRRSPSPATALAVRALHTTATSLSAAGGSTV